MNLNEDKPNTLRSFSLKEISSWQLDPTRAEVKLPSLQRGFVWKANQIETLWDSLLRGFPIGSILFSKSTDRCLLLLDGQQRATSISLGFYNPWLKNEEYKFLSLKKTSSGNNIPTVWLDLKPQKKTNSQKFVVRVLTQSHPWGYQRINNNIVLTLPERRQALKLFLNNHGNKEMKYIDFDSKKIFPYDADLPVPLSFLLESNSATFEKWRSDLISKIEKSNVFGKGSNLIEEKTYLKDLFKKELIDTNSEILENIFNVIKNLDQAIIPGILVNQKVLTEDETNENKNSEDPTLFVRLNSSGTRIAGEELIYSIYKSIFPKAKDLVEDIGANFIAPSLVISLVARLVASKEKDYPLPIKVNDFKNKIKIDAYKKKLEDYISNDAKIHFDKALKILSSEGKFNLPPVLIKSLIKGNTELFLLLLRWISLNPKPDVSDQNILATITAFAWFGKDNAKYVKEIWPKLNDNNKESFWGNSILMLPITDRKKFIVYPFIEPDLLISFLTTSVLEEKVAWEELASKFEEFAKNETKNKSNWEDFYKMFFWCRPLVIFAQRDYINSNFKNFNQMENLEDTNAPWDWDHIYPSGWVYRKGKIDSDTRKWTNTIGNLRAIALEENRSDQDAPPNKKLNQDSIKNSFIEIEDLDLWQKIVKPIKADKPETNRIHLIVIIHRLGNIYKEWNNTLKVSELFNEKEK